MFFATIFAKLEKEKVAKNKILRKMKKVMGENSTKIKKQQQKMQFSFLV
jgi:hypothetical protein